MYKDIERTFVMIKPDGVQRELVGEILMRFERRSLRIAGLKMMTLSRELAEKHYEEHKGEDYYEPLIAFVTSSPVVAIVFEGPHAVQLVRNMMGALNPEESGPGSIRGDFTASKRYNLVHGSDSCESAEREIKLFFRDDEIFEYTRELEHWLSDG